MTRPTASIYLLSTSLTQPLSMMILISKKVEKAEELFDRSLITSTSFQIDRLVLEKTTLANGSFTVETQ